MPALYGALTALFLGVGLVAIPMLRDQGPVERLGGRIGGAREPEQRRSVLARLVNHLAGRLGPQLAPSLRASRRATLERRLDYAGRPGGLSVQRFVGLKGALALLLGFGLGGLLVLLGASPVYMLALGAIGWWGPDVWLSRTGRLRQEAIERSLPDFLDILAVSVRAGLGYRLALRRVAEALEGPVSAEMLTVLRQMELGQDRREAFLALRERNRSESLKSFVGAQLQAEELGVPARRGAQRHRDRHAPHHAPVRAPPGAARQPARVAAGDDADRPRLGDPDPAVGLLRGRHGRREPVWLRLPACRVAGSTARAAGSPPPAG